MATMIPGTDVSQAARRADLDWIRVGAFALLIFYHIGMFYVTWDFHVKSDHAGPGPEPLMLLVNPWRLTLLFLVSGAATRYMADRFSPGALLGLRSWRLLPPLIFGMLVIVPPQSYYEVVEKAAYAGSYWDFWQRYLMADGGFCKDGECLILPTWNHLWFVAYLFVYTVVLIAVLAVAPRFARAGERFLEKALSPVGLLIWPVVFLAATRLVLYPMFDVTHAFIDDWYNHAVSLTAFLFGFCALKSETLSAVFVRMRWPALLLGLASYAAVATYFGAYADAEPPEALRALMRVVYSVDQWCFIVAVLGFGRRHLTRGGPVLTYLTNAVFPFYIVHQTIIIVAGHHLKALHLSAWTEFGVLTAITMAGCFLTYEIVRRIAVLRPLFGLRLWPARRREAVATA